MTEKEIDEMPSGREMDALVAIHVFDLQPASKDSSYYAPGLVKDRGQEVWAKPYSIGIAASLAAFERIDKRLESLGCIDDEGRRREKGSFFIRGPYLGSGFRAGWLERDGNYPLIETEADRLELALCRAALKAVLREVNDAEIH